MMASKSGTVTLAALQSNTTLSKQTGTFVPTLPRQTARDFLSVGPRLFRYQSFDSCLLKTETIRESWCSWCVHWIWDRHPGIGSASCPIVAGKIVVCLFVFFLFSPVNFLGGLSNRYTIAATFGATASKCATLFLYTASGINMYQLGGPGWLNSKFMALDLRNFF